MIQAVKEAVAFINNTQHKPKVGIVLGSGLSAFGENLKKSNNITFKFSDIPHFSSSSVIGHKGEFILGTIGSTPIVAMSGRLHLYEGYKPEQVVFPIRVMGLLGIKSLILTNASGAIADNFEPGQLMAIKDHLNLTGTSPLVGENIAEWGPRFLDMSEAYDPKLIKIAKKAASDNNILMHEGVYAGLLGPCYETPAEIRMLKILGADAVGMSTVSETIVARHMGIKVLGISCLTNKAAGLSTGNISHDEVIKNNAKVADKFSRVLSHIVKEIN
jgi:purine-nucleoside phosphorylase